MRITDTRRSDHSPFLKGKSAFLLAGVFLAGASQAQYCAVEFPSPEPICNVTFSNINNSSVGSTSAAGYEDFTAITGTVNPGSTYALSVTGNTDGPYINTLWAYFDWDGDGIFSGTNEVFLLGTMTFSNCDAVDAVTLDITVPSDAVAGDTRMRIIKQYGETLPSPNDGCTLAGLGYGQVEDYTLTIVVGQVCDALPEPGNTTGPEQICSGTSFTLGAEIQSFDLGLTYQWEISTDGTTWADAPGNSTGASFTTDQSEASWYRVQVTCADMGTGTSEPLSVAMAPGAECYCTTIDFVLAVEPICSVTFANVDNESPSAGAPGYEDFTDITAELVAGNEYLLSVTGNTSGNYTNYVSAFFDWDGDGQFETIVPIDSLVNTACGTTISVMVSVPTDAAPASRMRVVKDYSDFPVAPCASYFFGQAEDYAVEVTMSVGVSNVSTLDVNVYPNPASTEIFITAAQGAQVNVYDVLGHLVLQQRATDRLDIGHLAPGSYSALIFDQRTVNAVRVRFVKE
ncbi:MAG: T9SS type A sorting domain-containing protein [Flavobacteriales bacterium]|nr:T9SS type A sorting domain-containing protein [Flavobacteriales bacterium]